MRVLLVDDEEELVSALAERLLMRDIDAEWFTTGTDALQRVEAGCFDLAVLDMKMPKISGLALREKLHAKCPDHEIYFLDRLWFRKRFCVGDHKGEHGRLPG